MKRLQVIELGIIAVGLVTGFLTINSILNVFMGLLYNFSSDFGYNILVGILPSLAYFLFYAGSFFLIVRNIKPIAKYINGGNEDEIKLKLDKASILHVILVTISLISILKLVPDILISLYTFYKDAMGDISDLLEKVTKKVSVTDFWTKVISLVLTLVFLTYSKAIATYFGKDLQAFEIESEKNQTNQ